MGVFKNTDPDDNTNSMDTNTSLSRERLNNHQQEEQTLARVGPGGAAAGGHRLPSSELSTELPAEDEVIPWKFVPPLVIRRLVHKLNPEMPLSGNDWKALAGALGLNSEEIRFCGSVQWVHSEFLLNAFATKPDASLNEMLAALQSINRKDCVDIIREALPEIRQKVQASINTPPMLQITEGTSMMSGHSGFMWSNGGTMFVPPFFQNSSPSMGVVGQPASGICCVHGHVSLPSSHMTSSHGDNRLSQQQVPGFSSLSAGSGTPTGGVMGLGFCSATGSGMISSSPVTGCLGSAQQQQQQHMLQQARPQQNFGELGCMRMETAMSDNISPVHNSFTQVSYNNINTNCSGNAQSQSQWEGACEDSFNSNQHMDCGGNMVRQKVARQISDDCKTGQHHYHHGNKHLKNSTGMPSQECSSYQRCGGESRPGQSKLLAASPNSHSSQPSPPTAGQSGLRQNNQTFFAANSGGRREPTNSPRKLIIPSPSSSPLEERGHFASPSPSSGSPRDICQCRAAKSVKSSNSGGQNTGSPKHINGMPAATSGFFSSVHNSPHLHRGDQIVPQSQGGMCNVQTQDPPSENSMDGLSTNSEDLVSNHAHQRNEQGTSLSHLEKLAAMPDAYKPSSKYQTVVAEQKIEAERGKKSKSSKSARQISSTLAREPGSGFSSFNSNSSGCSSSSPSICSASQTFPMRVKGRHERDGRGGQGGGGGGGGGFITGVEGLGSLTISKKSVSMPQDMKPQPYRKAWRGIKVFVTYSMDNPEHNDQVLCLGYFLKNNGFNCYLDTPVKPGKSPQAWLEHIEKFHRKFKESDFVLVCISPKYLQDVSVSEPVGMNQSLGESRLHTLEIYQLMNQDYLNRQAFEDGAETEGCGGRSGPPLGCVLAPSSESPHSPQVVPVLFGAMTASQIPAWMREVGVPCKRWEADYADLAWLLTKPQNRIRPSRLSNAQTSAGRL